MQFFIFFHSSDSSGWLDESELLLMIHLPFESEIAICTAELMKSFCRLSVGGEFDLLVLSKAHTCINDLRNMPDLPGQKVVDILI